VANAHPPRSAVAETTVHRLMNAYADVAEGDPNQESGEAIQQSTD